MSDKLAKADEERRDGIDPVNKLGRWQTRNSLDRLTALVTPSDLFPTSGGHSGCEWICSCADSASSPDIPARAE